MWVNFLYAVLIVKLLVQIMQFHKMNNYKFQILKQKFRCCLMLALYFVIINKQLKTTIFFIFLAFSATTMELCKQLQQPKKS